MQKSKQAKKANGGFWDKVTRIPLVYLVFLVIAFLIYGQTLKFYLGKFDEDLLILGNLNSLKELSGIKIAFLRDAFLSDKGVSFYRPLQTVTYMMDAQFFGTRGSVFYFTNILIHAAACSTLFYLLGLLGNSRKTAFILALLFLTSPLFVHAIAWAPSRGDLLIGLTGILTMVFFVKLVRTQQYKYAAFAMLAFAAAVFSKETAVLIPVVIAFFYILMVKDRKKSLPAALIAFAGFLVVLVLYFFLRFHAVKLATPAAEFGMAPFLHNLRTLPEYIAKFFIPVHLAPMAGFTVLNTILGLIIIIMLGFFTIRYSSKPFSKELFGFGWFLVFVIPGMMYSHKLGSAAYDYLEHRAYLPMAGIMMLLLFILTGIPEGKIRSRVNSYMLLLAVALGIYSFFYAGNYENPMVFYDHAVSSNPASAMALSNRGLIRAGLKDYRGAIADYEKAVTIKPDYAQAYVNKGISLAAMNDHAGAIMQYDEAIGFDPDLFQAHFNKGNSLYSLGSYNEALREYDRAVKIYPSYVSGYTARGALFFQIKDYISAENDFSAAIKLDSSNSTAYLNRGKSRFNANNRAGARSDWIKASNLGDPEARELLDKYGQ